MSTPKYSSTRPAEQERQVSTPKYSSTHSPEQDRQVSTPKYSSLYDHHDGPAITEFDESRTKQEFREESDINHIMDHYQVTGLLPATANQEPIYGDFSDPALQDYQAATQIVRGAGDLMARLPAKTRERFGNDVASLLQFVSDKNNRQEAIELGLIEPPPVAPAPARPLGGPAPVVQPGTPAAPDPAGAKP